MKIRKLLLILLPVFFLSMLYVNFLSGTGKINGLSAGEVSALFPTYFTPAGFTFTIWGVIYLFNLLFVIYAVVNGLKEPEGFPSRKLVLLYSITCLINICWVFAWHYLEISVSMILMLLLLVVLTRIYQEVTIRQKKSIQEYMLTVIPVSVYLGWIVVATVANAAVTLVYLRWSVFGLAPYVVASVVIVLAAIVNIMVLLKKKDVFFSLVFLWAAMGIISARRAEGTPESDIVAVTAIVCMGIVFLVMIYTRFFVIRAEKENEL